MASKCLKCGVEIEYPDFQCKKQPGNHTVEEKTYYHLGAAAIADVKDRRRFAPIVVLVPSYDYMDEKTGKTAKTKGIVAEFHDGKLATSDCELQYHLDLKQFPNGDSGLEQWRKIYLTEAQQVDVAKSELAELSQERDRIVKEKNSLLEQVKRSKANG